MGKTYNQSLKQARSKQKVAHFLHVPFTGLGNYSGYRGANWLKNRIKIFKQFVVPSLLQQTKKDFILWVAWRREEKNNSQVIELKEWLDTTGIKSVFTYSGIAFWDDKYDEVTARVRLLDALHGSMGALINVMGEADTVLLTIQPSDDVYDKRAVEGVRHVLSTTDNQAFGFSKGYIMDYQIGKLAEWNPKTNPPFYTIKFPRDIFIDPLKHAEYTAIKEDCGQYKAGTPIPSHEYVGKALKYAYVDERGFLVGTHSDNISTIFKHPYAGEQFSGEERYNILKNFGLQDLPLLKVKFSLRKKLMRKLPHKVLRKLRFLAGEKKWWGRPIFNLVYNFLRG